MRKNEPSLASGAWQSGQSANPMPFARRLLAAMCLFAGILLSAASAAAPESGYTVDSVPNPRLENTSFHVSDPDGLLEKGTVSSINGELSALEKSTGIQSAVVVLPSIGDGDDFEFAQDLFRKWGIGDKERNDGLLVLYVDDQRVIRIHTGYGLEGPLPDAICKRIEQQDMIPYFKEGKIDEGLKAGVSALCKRLSSDESATEQDGGNAAVAEGDGDEAESSMNFYAIAGTVILIIIFSIGVAVYQRFEKCPHCGKRGTMKEIKRDEFKNGEHETLVSVVRRCSNCGYEEEKTYTETHGDGSSSSSSGGGFSGGSTGGGGSSSRW